MKNLFLLLFLVSASVAANSSFEPRHVMDLGIEQKASEEDIYSKIVPLAKIQPLSNYTKDKTPSKRTGVGSISGSIYDSETGQLVSLESSLYLTVNKWDEVTNKWVELESFYTSESNYEILNLEDGKYYIHLFNFDYFYNTRNHYYLSTIWHQKNVLTQDSGSISNDNIIEITNGVSQSERDFRLTSGGLLIVNSNAFNQYSSPKFYAIDEAGKLFESSSETYQWF